MQQIKFLTIPTECPICKEKLIIKTSSTGVQELFCPNEECDGRLLNKLQHFVSKKGLDIKGISKATLEKLMDWGWIYSPADIFNLHLWQKEWAAKPGFGVKSVEKILTAIEEARNVELYQFISSLGIPLIGISVAKELAKIFPTYEEFRQAIENNYDFSQLPNFGYEKTQALLNFNYVTGDLISEELNITNDFAKQQNEVQDKLKGLIFVVTGKLQTFKNRTELKELVEKNGGKLTDSVSSKTNYLINNDINSNTGKNKTAKSLGVPIITEQQFISLLN